MSAIQGNKKDLHKVFFIDVFVRGREKRLLLELFEYITNNSLQSASLLAAMETIEKFQSPQLVKVNF